MLFTTYLQGDFAAGQRTIGPSFRTAGYCVGTFATTS
jgi:hypothetical protein